MGTFTQPAEQPSGKSSITNSATSGQPQLGQPNQYPNTIQQGGWDNATIGNQAMGQSNGKGGKGGGWQPFQSQWSSPNTDYLNPQPTQISQPQPQNIPWWDQQNSR